MKKYEKRKEKASAKLPQPSPAPSPIPLPNPSHTIPPTPRKKQPTYKREIFILFFISFFRRDTLANHHVEISFSLPSSLSPTTHSALPSGAREREPLPSPSPSSPAFPPPLYPLPANLPHLTFHLIHCACPSLALAGLRSHGAGLADLVGVDKEEGRHGGGGHLVAVDHSDAEGAEGDHARPPLQHFYCPPLSLGFRSPSPSNKAGPTFFLFSSFSTKREKGKCHFVSSLP